MNKEYYKIGEVSKLLEVNSSTIRFWETEFRQLKPLKTNTNQRYYTQKHINFLKDIKHMLYNEKLTIEGVKKRLNTDKASANHISEIDKNYLKQELINILEILK